MQSSLTTFFKEKPKKLSFEQDEVLDFSKSSDKSELPGDVLLPDPADLTTPVPIARHSMPAALNFKTPVTTPVICPKGSADPAASSASADAAAASVDGAAEEGDEGGGSGAADENDSSAPLGPLQKTPVEGAHKVTKNLGGGGDLSPPSPVRKRTTMGLGDFFRSLAPPKAASKTCLKRTIDHEDQSDTKKAKVAGEPAEQSPKAETDEPLVQLKDEPPGGRSDDTLLNPFSKTGFSKAQSTSLEDANFDPSALDVAAIKTAKGFKFSFLASILQTAENWKGSGLGSKKKVAVLLSNFFRTLLWHHSLDLVPSVWYCFNRTAPDYEGKEPGIGDSLILAVMQETYGRTKDSLQKDAVKYEDLGKVAELSRCTVRQLAAPAALTIRGVFESLASLPDVTKVKSQERKKDIIKKLLTAASGVEAKYLIRFLQQRLRIGVQSATVVQAVAFAFTLTSGKVADARRSGGARPLAIEGRLIAMEAAVKRALSCVSNVELVIGHLLDGADEKQLNQVCCVTPGVPVQPMLAKPTKGLEEVFARFSDVEFTCEFKYDGERAQVHILPPQRKVQIFSRNMENLTLKYPDVAVIAQEAVSAQITDLIVDSEVVAYDSEKQKILPFQVLAGRKRKNVTAGNVAVNVCLFPFDCIRCNGESLTDLPLRERRKFLYDAFTEQPGRLMFAAHSEMRSLEEVDAFLQEAIDYNCEGLMVKTLDTNASYEPSKRSLNWLKIKKDYLEHLTDSVDLVPLGAFYGKGKRHKVFGSYLLGCFNAEDETFQSTCKVATGFTDEMLVSLHKALQDAVTATKDPAFEVSERLAPDVWFKPIMCWEVRAADLSISPVHTAAFGRKAKDKGIGLRFPRFVRIREDKNPVNATTSGEILAMYESQFVSARKLDATAFSSDDDADEAAG